MKKFIDSLISNAVYSLMSLLAFVILAKGVDLNIFGTWVIVLTVSSFVDQIRFGITRNATIHLIAQNSYSKSHLINGAGLRLCFKMLVVVSVIFLSMWAVGREVFPQAYTKLLFWYPFLGLSTTVWNNGYTWLQWRSKFKQITLLRVVVGVTFIAQLIAMLYLDKATIDNIIIAYILSNALASVVCFLKGWDSSRHVLRAPKEMDQQIFNLGRYSTISHVGAGLFKFTDVLIICLSPVMGVEIVAVYAIPFKIVEMIEIPVRSIAIADFNNLLEKFRVGIASSIRTLLARYAIIMTVLIIPAMIFISIFPDFVLDLFSGTQYTKYYDEMRTMIRLLLLYGVLLIPEWLSSISLEAMGKPRFNSQKLLMITFASFLGNVIAVFYFQSIIGVVFVTLILTVLGTFASYLMLPKSIRPTLEEWTTEFRKLFWDFGEVLKKKYKNV